MNNEFKFEPIWTSVLSLLALYFIYGTITAFMAKPSYDGFGILFLSFPILFSAMVLPMAFKMLMGIPAIRFTQDQLIDNVVGVKIDWSNI